MYASNDTQSQQNSKLSELHLERAQAAATGMGNGNEDWGLRTGVDWIVVSKLSSIGQT